MRTIELRQRHMRLCDNSKTQDPFECERCVKKINEDISKLDTKWLSNEDLAIINTVKISNRKAN